MRRINRCINVKLQKICQEVVHLEELNAHVRHFLPELLRPQCHVGSFNKGCLVLITKDSVWASQLRYSLPELRDKLRCEAGIYQLVAIKIMVAIDNPQIEKHPTIVRPISTKAKMEIKEAADLCHYLPLREVLHRLVD